MVEPLNNTSLQPNTMDVARASFNQNAPGGVAERRYAQRTEDKAFQDRAESLRQVEETATRRSQERAAPQTAVGTQIDLHA